MLISIQKYFLFLLNGGDTNQEYYCLQFYGSIWFVYQRIQFVKNIENNCIKV